MATRLPYAQGESGNVVIVGTCLDIARTSGRECRGQVGLPRLFCEWHQILAIHTILTHRLTQPTQRRLNLVGESGKFSNCPTASNGIAARIHCGQRPHLLQILCDLCEVTVSAQAVHLLHKTARVSQSHANFISTSLHAVKPFLGF